MGAYKQTRISGRSTRVANRRLDVCTDHDTEDAVGGCDDSVARTPILRGEELRRDGVKDAVHDVARECERAIPAEKCVRRSCCGACKEEDTSDDCEDGANCRVSDWPQRVYEVIGTNWLKWQGCLCDQAQESRPSIRQEGHQEHQ